MSNPGLMQSHAGSSFVGNSASADEQKASIIQMIVDGTQGTSAGDGLVQLINQYGNIYEVKAPVPRLRLCHIVLTICSQAARGYNSGSIDERNLNNPIGATASYVCDIANRVTGWVSASKEPCS